ncbi:leucine-rich repeat-containing protein 51-like [Ptychodera flava]|uniref:leucine-rich repeat-containing protein 51-like n=1 Tax=Ptychodera flava TaxID=63121 RepID=UPI00396AA7F6
MIAPRTASSYRRYRKPVVESSLDMKETVYSAPPLELSFRTMLSLDYLLRVDVRDIEPREFRGKKLKRDEQGRFCTTALKLNNNMIDSWSGFDEVVNKLISNPDDLNWVDLSFNALSSIDDVILKYPNIKILHLHGNEIEDLSDVDKLAKMPKLKSVSLHGNPIEQEKRYRTYMLTTLPQIRTLDLCTITKADRETAATMGAMFNVRVKQRKNRKWKSNAQSY